MEKGCQNLSMPGTQICAYWPGWNSNPCGRSMVRARAVPSSVGTASITRHDLFDVAAHSRSAI
eukprot:scaffold1698_cov33-Tisochrysis_lutea.AAC.2